MAAKRVNYKQIAEMFGHPDASLSGESDLVREQFNIINQYSQIISQDVNKCQALHYYTSGVGFDRINRYLRGLIEEYEIKMLEESGDLDLIRKIIKTLLKILAEAPQVPNNYYVYRGLSLDAHHKEFKIGDKVELGLDTFSSTTTNPLVASGFVGTSTCCVFVIKLGPLTRSVFIPTKCTKFEDESEILLPPGLIFQVTDADGHLPQNTMWDTQRIYHLVPINEQDVFDHLYELSDLSPTQIQPKIFSRYFKHLHQKNEKVASTKQLNQFEELMYHPQPRKGQTGQRGETSQPSTKQLKQFEELMYQPQTRKGQTDEGDDIIGFTPFSNQTVQTGQMGDTIKFTPFPNQTGQRGRLLNLRHSQPK